MILVLDVGNSQIACGLYDGEKMVASFRKSSAINTSSDELGIFLRAVLHENGFSHDVVENIAICSVVPHIMYSLRSACMKYFNIQPFVLEMGVKTGLKIKFSNPAQVGADRIAGSIAGVKRFPDTNLIIVDLGTANTVCAVSKDAEFLGGVIMPGMKMTAESLERGTAKLPLVEIVKPDGEVTARTTEAAIQNGIYFGALDSLKGAIARIGLESFKDEGYMVIGTGGFARLFEDSQLFESVVPEMVLEGTYLACKMNMAAR